MDALLDDSCGPRRFNLYLLTAFAAVALALAAIGLFGVIAYLVSQRTREIGVRLALGATRGEMFTLILGRGMMLAGIGAAIGVGAALWLSRVMETLLFLGIQDRRRHLYYGADRVAIGSRTRVLPAGAESDEGGSGRGAARRLRSNT